MNQASSAGRNVSKQSRTGTPARTATTQKASGPRPASNALVEVGAKRFQQSSVDDAHALLERIRKEVGGFAGFGQAAASPQQRVKTGLDLVAQAHPSIGA